MGDTRWETNDYPLFVGPILEIHPEKPIVHFTMKSQLPCLIKLEMLEDTDDEKAAVAIKKSPSLRQLKCFAPVI